MSLLTWRIHLWDSIRSCHLACVYVWRACSWKGRRNFRREVALRECRILIPPGERFLKYVPVFYRCSTWLYNFHLKFFRPQPQTANPGKKMTSLRWQTAYKLQFYKRSFVIRCLNSSKLSFSQFDSFSLLAPICFFTCNNIICKFFLLLT